MNRGAKLHQGRYGTWGRYHRVGAWRCRAISSTQGLDDGSAWRHILLPQGLRYRRRESGHRGSQFRRAGVAELIELFVGTSPDFVSSGRCPPRVDLLLLEADGRIDRDLDIFYPRMQPGAPIIVRPANSAVLQAPPPSASTHPPRLDRLRENEIVRYARSPIRPGDGTLSSSRRR